MEANSDGQARLMNLKRVKIPMYFNLEMGNLMVQCNPKTFKIMRRSLRDSIVGFSLLGGILIFTFFSFWLRGVRLSSKNWHLFA